MNDALAVAHVPGALFRLASGAVVAQDDRPLAVFLLAGLVVLAVLTVAWGWPPVQLDGAGFGYRAADLMQGRWVWRAPP